MGRKSSKTEDRPAPREDESDDEALLDETEDQDGADSEESGDSEADTDNVGEVSVEINVEDLIKELEGSQQANHSGDMNSARRKLEDYLEERRIARDVMDFEDYDLDD